MCVSIIMTCLQATEKVEETSQKQIITIFSNSSKHSLRNWSKIPSDFTLFTTSFMVFCGSSEEDSPAARSAIFERIKQQQQQRLIYRMIENLFLFILQAESSHSEIYLSNVWSSYQHVWFSFVHEFFLGNLLSVLFYCLSSVVCVDWSSTEIIVMK